MSFLKTKTPPLFDAYVSLAHFYERVLECARTSKFSFCVQENLVSIASQKFNELLLLEECLKSLGKDQKKDRAYFEKITQEIRRRIKDFSKNMDLAYEEYCENFQKEGYVFLKEADLSYQEKEKCKEFIRTVLFSSLKLQSENFAMFPHDSFVLGGIYLNENKEEQSIFYVPRTSENFLKLSEKEGIFLGDMMDLLFEELRKHFLLLKELFYFCPLRRDAIEMEDFLKTANAQVEQVRENVQNPILAVIISSDASLEIRKKISRILQVSSDQVFIMKERFFRKKSLESSGFWDFKKEEKRGFSEPFKKRKGEETPLEEISKKDILLHTPFDSFDFLLNFILQSCEDPTTISIMQTLYRCPFESPLIEAFISAAQKGKEVSVLVETRASMDEENNRKIAEKLSQNGVFVAYGKPEGLTHAKLCLVSQRQKEGIKKFLHVGTGNYHAEHAKHYTDFSFFTCSPEICEGAESLFREMLYAQRAEKKEGMHFYSSGSGGIKDQIISSIEGEISNKKKGKEAGIFLKCTRLLDPDIIQRLYEASQWGVPCELIIRSICALKPGVKNLSKNIRVKSLVGPYLEHSRVYCFYNNAPLGSQGNKVFISSADLSPYNFEDRTEVMVEILDGDIRRYMTQEILMNYKKDTNNSWILKNDGAYIKVNASASKDFDMYKFLSNQ